MKKGFLFVLLSCMITLIYSQTIVKEHYTVSGGILGAANFTDFRVNNATPAIDYNTKAGWSIGGWVNFPAGRKFSIEPQVMFSSYQYVTNSTSTNVLIKDGKIRYISVPLQFKLEPSDKFAFVIGPQVDFMSSLENNPGSNGQEDNFQQTSFSGLAGIEILPHGRVTIFGRYIHGFSNMYDVSGESNDLEYKNQNIQAGLKFKLFGKKVDADSDGDGVIDKNDKCPSTFGYARYDGCPIPDTDGDGINDEEDKCPNQAGTLKYQGCPVPDRDKDGINDEEDKCPDVAGLAKYQGCPIPDTDKDGINDEEDKCPNVAGLAKYQGCPIPDTDKDGINDEEDKCPDVPGVAANQGCPAVAEVSPEVNKALGGSGQSVAFTSNSGKLATTSNASLNKIATILKNNPDVKIKIEGHADNKEKNADDLAMQRANAVKAYFVSKGISEDRIKVDSEGSSMPIGDNNTVAGRTKNRRVEIKLDM
jgi:outer membrane protein OmpA-like peptidoglycan-associated protein